MSSQPEVSPAILNSGLAVAASACQKGEPTAWAIDSAVKHIRTRQALSMLDESRVRDWLQRELPAALRAKPAEAKPEEPAPVAAANQLYRMTGPTKFTAVGKPPFIFPPLWLYRLIDGQTVRKLSADCIQRRKIIVATAAVLFLVAGLFPPWIQTYDLNETHTQSDAGYAFLLSPPPPRDYTYAVGIKLDRTRLTVELACVLAVGIGVWFWFGGEKKNSGKS